MKNQPKRRSRVAKYAQAYSKIARVAQALQKSLETRAMPSIKLGQNESIQLHRIIAPAVEFGLVQLRTKTIHDKRILAPSVWKDLAQYLFSRLCFALGPLLRLQDSAAKAVARTEGRNRNEITLRETLFTFPGVLDLLARIISAWIDAQSELLDRLSTDQRGLTKFFLTDRQAFRVLRVRPGLSDPHDIGRTSTLIELAGGTRVIYKPRGAYREQIWFESLSWLNRNGFIPRFRIPKLVGRKGYSWMDFVARRPCETLDAVRCFYFRWGAQAALAQVLTLTDLHRENWVSAGSQPVLVDAEFIGDAELPRKVKDERVAARTPSLILQTGLLPITSRDRLGVYEGIGPFDSRAGENALMDCWAKYKKSSQKPQRYVAELVRGFEAIAELFQNSSVAQKFFCQVIAPHRTRNHRRVLPRSSAQYTRLLRASLEPINLNSTDARARYIKTACTRAAQNQSIASAEIEGLLWCDIPKIEQPTTTVLSRRRFMTAVAELQKSTRLFRSRVRLKGSGLPRGRSGKRRSKRNQPVRSDLADYQTL